MNSTQFVHSGYSMALLQSCEWSLQGPRAIRGGPLLYRDQLNIAGNRKRNSLFSECSILDSGHGGQFGVSRWRSHRRCTGRVNSRRKDYGNISSLERLVRRTVKSEEEQERKEESIKEEEPKSVAKTPTHTQLEAVVARARGVLMTARIFTAMMAWVTLFFMASVWEGDSQSFNDPGKKNGKRGPRR